MNQLSRLLRVAGCMTQSNSLTAGKVSLAGKRFLVTGGSSGIGVEVAKTLALWGVHLMISCRSEEKGKAIGFSALCTASDNSLVNIGITHFHFSHANIDYPTTILHCMGGIGA